MNYKLEGALKRNRKYFIICGILWILGNNKETGYDLEEK